MENTGKNIGKNIIKILHGADYHVKNRDKNNISSIESNLSNIKQKIIDTEADVYLIAGDLFDNATPNDSERKLIYRHIGEVLNIPTLKEFVFIVGNHDILFDKKQIDSNKDTNALDTLNQFIETLTPELAKKITYCKKQEYYQSIANNKLGWIPYSLEDGMSNGNNFDWQSVNNDNYNITLFHDIVRDYIEDSKLPVRKDKLQFLPYVTDFQTNLILAGDIHVNWNKKTIASIDEQSRHFYYPGSTNQVNFAEGDYIRIRNKSQSKIVPLKSTKLFTIDLDSGEYIVKDLKLDCYISYITLDFNSAKIVENYEEQLLELIEKCNFGSKQTYIKIKLSSSYVSEEIKIFKLIENICNQKNTLYNISTVYDKIIIDIDTNVINGDEDSVDLEYDELENSDFVFNQDDLKLTKEKLQLIFDNIVNQYRVTLLKEYTDENIINEILDTIKSLFAEQIEFSMSAIPNFKIDLLNIETTGFMNLDANKINLDIPGITKINGRNGIGKTTLLNMLRFVIRGVLFDNLKATNKKQNALLVFNDKLIDQDSVIVRLIQNINGTQVAITRKVFRKWKKSATDEIKKSLEWKEHISDVTSSIVVDIASKDGSKSFTGDEAEKLVSTWYGDVAQTILILNQQKILNLLNLSSDKLKELVLSYIGVDYVELLKENLEGIKSKYDLVKPKVSIESLKLDYIENKKLLKYNLDVNKTLVEDISELNSNIIQYKDSINNINKQLIDLGKIDSKIEDVNNQIVTSNEIISKFERKEKKIIEEFTSVEPVKNTDLISTINNKIVVIDSEIVNIRENSVKLIENKNDLKSKLVINIQQDIITNKEIIKNECDTITNHYINSNDLLKSEIDKEFEFLTNEYTKILEILTETKNRTTIQLSEFHTSINNLKSNNIELQKEIDSGICESCNRPFGTDHEEHSKSLQQKIDSNLIQITEIQKLIDELSVTNSNVIIQLPKFQSYYNMIVKLDINGLMNLPSDVTVKMPHFEKIVLCDGKNKIISYNNIIFGHLNFDTIRLDYFKEHNLFTDKIEIIENSIGLVQTHEYVLSNLVIETIKLLLYLSSNNYKYSDEIVNIFKLLKSSTEEQNIIDEKINNRSILLSEISKIETEYTNLVLLHNQKLLNHNEYVKELIEFNDNVDKHNNSVIEIYNKITQLNDSLKTLETQLPLYLELVDNLEVIHDKLLETENSFVNKNNQLNNLNIEDVNIQNKLDIIDSQLEDWTKYKHNTFVYSIYRKIIKDEFPDAVFEYYRIFLNKSLNILLEDLNFKLYWNKTGDLFMIELGQGQKTFRPVQLSSGMQTSFLGLALIYSIHLLNVKNDVSHIFIDEISGTLNKGDELQEKLDVIDYQEQLVILLNKFSNKKIFIVDHHIKNLYQTTTYEVVLNESKLGGKFIITD